MTKTISVRVHLINLMLQSARECKNPTIAMGFDIAQSCLQKNSEKDYRD